MTYRQKFVNTGKDPIECTFVHRDFLFSRYQFVLEPQATVCDFFAEVDGKKIHGICKEKEKAKDSYVIA